MTANGRTVRRRNASPDMMPSAERPGIRIYAPTWRGAPAPEADYVCKCGRSETAIGYAACLELIKRFHTDHDAHMDASYADIHAMNLTPRLLHVKAA